MIPERAAVDGTLTAALARLVASIDVDNVPTAALELVRQAFVDCVGCALAGARTPDAQLVAAWVQSLASSPLEAELVAVRGAAAPASLAALANGAAAHALDLDDFSPTMNHPSVCLVPALLALGQRQRSTGRDIELAYVAGFEVMARICRALNPEHYARGWHSTSTVGVLGVAAAAAHLLRLDERGIGVAVGIAASMSAGARQNFGTMVKPLHAGLAAFQGISAVQLAGRGVTANESILDGPRGFFSLYRGEGAPRVSSAMFDMGRFELVDSGIAFKRFACCGCIHAALEATLAIADRHCLNARDIRAVQCVTNRFSPEILIHNRASTPAEARFCVEYSLAVALIDGDAGATQYTPERTADPVVQDLAARIVVETDDELPVGTATFPAVVTIETRSGESFTERRDTARGRAGDPLTWDDLEEKFRGNAACELTASAAEELLGQIRALPELDDVGRIPRAWRGST